MSSILNSVSSMIAQRQYAQNASKLFTTLEKLSTGRRINSGGDDPAGLIAAENLRAEIAATNARVSSYTRADAVANVADAALGSMSGMLTRAESLEIRLAGNAGLSSGERDAIQMELDSIVASVDRIAGSTQFNGRNLLDGTASLQVDGHVENLPDVSSASLGQSVIGADAYALSDVATGGAAAGDPEAAQQVIRAASNDVATARGRLGAFQANHIQPSVRAEQVAMENLAAAYSMIADTDFAAQSASLQRDQLLMDAAASAMMLTNLQAASVVALVG